MNKFLMINIGYSLFCYVCFILINNIKINKEEISISERMNEVDEQIKRLQSRSETEEGRKIMDNVINFIVNYPYFVTLVICFIPILRTKTIISSFMDLFKEEENI